MSIGLGQILLIIIIGLILFGKFPGLSKDLLNGLNSLQNLLKQKQKDTLNSEEDSTKIKSIDDLSHKSSQDNSKSTKN